MTMSRTEREHLEVIRWQVREGVREIELGRWMDHAAAGGDPGPMPEVPHGWEAWRARDPDGFAAHLEGRWASSHAKAERQQAEADQAAEGERREGERYAGAVLGALVAVGLVVVVVIAWRRRRARLMPEVRPAPTHAEPQRPLFGLYLPGL